MNPLYRSALALGLATAVLAPVAPMATAQAQTAQTTAAASRAIANTHRYKDAGKKPATGRAGSATLSVRALMNANNTTDLEVTTGAHDSTAPAPGQFTKVQLKAYADSGDLMYARNYTNPGTGGRFGVTLGDVRRGQPLQVQTNVRGIDGNRTDVLTLIETVKLRPDLEVSDLTAPATAPRDTPVTISAIVRERNMDVGATAKAVLLVDGAQVDSATGAWVDAGGFVSFAFSHAFTSLGTKQIHVRLENVAPSDYDATNNAVSGSIDILDPVQPADRTSASIWGMTAFQRNYSYSGAFRLADGTYPATPDWRESYQQGGPQQSAFVESWKTGAAFEGPVTVSLTETSDGQTVVSKTWEEVPVLWDYIYDNGQLMRRLHHLYDPELGGYVEVLVTSGAVNQVYAQVSRYVGDVVYHSTGHTKYSNGPYWSDPSNVNYYEWNYQGHDTNGQLVPLGSQHGFALTYGAVGGTPISGTVTVPITPFDYSYSYPDRTDEVTNYSGKVYRQTWADEQTYIGGVGWASTSN